MFVSLWLSTYKWWMLQMILNIIKYTRITYLTFELQLERKFFLRIRFIVNRVSKWLLLNAKWAIRQLYHNEKHCSRRARLGWVLILLADGNNSQWLYMLLYSNTLSLFWASRYLLSVLAWLEEKQPILILSSLDSNPRSTALEAST
jgi:hypothetical protein